MSYQGPSLIGNNNNFYGSFPYVYTTGTIKAAGNNDIAKLEIDNSLGFAVFTVDTQTPQITVGANVIPSGTTYNLGSALNKFNTIYVKTAFIDTLTFTGAVANQVVQTDGSGNLKTSNTLPNAVSATNMNLTTPTIPSIANLTTNGFVKTSGGTGTLIIDSNTYMSSVNPSWTGTMSTPLTVSSIVQTDGSGNLTGSNTLPTTVITNNLQPVTTLTNTIGTSSLFYATIYNKKYYVGDANTTIDNVGGNMVFTLSGANSIYIPTLLPNASNSYALGGPSNYWSSVSALQVNTSAITPLSGSTITSSATLLPLTTNSYNLGSASLSWSTVYAYTVNTRSDFIPFSNNGYNLGSATAYWAKLYATTIFTNDNLTVGTNNAYNIGSATNYWAKIYVTTLLTNDNIVPGADNTYNLGASATRWANLYAATVSASTSVLTNTINTYSGSAITVTAEKTLTLSTAAAAAYTTLVTIKNTNNAGAAGANGCSFLMSYFNGATAASVNFIAGGTHLNLVGSGACTGFISGSLTLGETGSYWSTAYLTNVYLDQIYPKNTNIICNSLINCIGGVIGSVTNGVVGTYSLATYTKNNYTGTSGTSGDIGHRFIVNGNAYDIVCSETGLFYPGTDNAYTWGTPSKRWQWIYTAALTMSGTILANNITPNATNTYACGASGSRWSYVYGVNGDFTGVMNVNYASGTAVTVNASGASNLAPAMTITCNTSSGSYPYLLVLSNTNSSSGTGFRMIHNGTTDYMNLFLDANGVAYQSVGNFYPQTTSSLGTLGNRWAGVYTTFLNANGAVAPGTDNTYTCGTGALRWTVVYATTGTINTSDEREKNTILPVADSMGLPFINALKPVSYKWNVRQNQIDDQGNVTPLPGIRTHYGLISQDVQALMTNLGMTTDDFAGFVYDAQADKYGLRYEEFISPMIKAIQQLKAQVDVINLQLTNLTSK